MDCLPKQLATNCRALVKLGVLIVVLCMPGPPQIAAADFPIRPITIVCPWAAGGGTDRVSRQIAVHLEQQLGVPVNVINATGGKGVTGHHRGLTARADGYTLTMMTFELCTMHWMGLTDLTYEDCEPLLSLNEDYAALIVAADAPWQSLVELEEAIRVANSPLTASGTAAGGAWHLAQAGWLDAAGIEADKVTWVPSQGSSPSLQQLIAGGVDMVCCSLPEARTLLDSSAVRALGVMAPERSTGFENTPTFTEQGRKWNLGGWRGIGVPRGVPADRIRSLRDALTTIVEQPVDNPNSFAAFMQKQKFDATTRPSAEFRSFMAENDRILGKLIASDAMESTRTDRFSPHTFPAVLFVVLMVSGAASIVQRYSTTSTAKAADAVVRKEGITNPLGAVGIVAAVVGYCLFAEMIGFIVTSVVLMLVILITCRALTAKAALVALALPAIVYVIFAWGMRVGLPVGVFPLG